MPGRSRFKQLCRRLNYKLLMEIDFLLIIRGQPHNWNFSNNGYLACQMEKEMHENTGRWSTGYQALKNLARAAFFIFYRRIEVYGRENIPGDGGLIFAANHRNALMDALAVLLTNQYQPVYLARADIFRNRFAAMILRFLKIVPVYRFRDGVGSMGQNEATFEKTSAVLAGGGCIGIMPEGNHGDQKRIRMLKKGIFRIAFRAMDDFRNGHGVRIVPVGLDFTDTRRFREELVVNYGSPIAVSGYMDLYREHPQKGINAIRDELSARMQDLVINIRDEKNYEVDRLLMETGSGTLKKQETGDGPGCSSRFLIQKAFAEAMYEYFDREPSAAEELRDLGGRLLELLNRHGADLTAVRLPGRGRILAAGMLRLLCYPVFLAGAVIHLVPLALIRLALMKLKDPQFISSFKYVLGFVLVPLNYLIAGIILFLTLPAGVAATLLVAMPVTGLLAHWCYRYSERAGRMTAVYRSLVSAPDDRKTVTELADDIAAGLDPVMRSCREKTAINI
ncbi:MAG: hypothetical protein EA408_02330 [Marinilabiliales bacterium]|nr:MAG: hypothetical protein EA408_02330 [Marinilabiliales bacterium]